MKFRFLTQIIIISVLATIILPVFSIFFVYPSFNNLQVQLTEEVAEKIAAHLSESLISQENELTKENVSENFLEDVKIAMRDFQLIKIKVFTSSGEIIFSNEQKDIGEINKHSYFHQIVARGNNYSKTVRKDTKSLEGQSMTTDVVETYIPIMKNSKFLGAFEIYMDITKEKSTLDRLIYISTSVSLAVMIILFGGVILTSLRAKKYILEKEIAEEKVQQAMRDWEDTFNTITDMITIHDKDFNIIKANTAARQAFGDSDKTPMILKKCYKCYHGSDNPPEGCPSCASMNTGEPSIFEVYEPHLNKDIEIRAIPRFNENRDLIGLIHIVRDISIRKLMEKNLKDLAEIDFLTMIYNRRMFLNYLNVEIETAKRYRRFFSLIMFDIDHFKKVNDSFGHDIGDYVLKAVVEIVKVNIRKADIFARYGGEEFLILSSETDINGARICAEKIRGIIENFHFDMAEHITVSVGVTEFRENDNMDSITKRVDNALYAAKNNGRNRVEVAN